MTRPRRINRTLQPPTSNQIATFLHRVRGLTIGYSCYDLFAITNASMSNVSAPCLPTLIHFLASRRLGKHWLPLSGFGAHHDLNAPPGEARLKWAEQTLFPSRAEPSRAEPSVRLGGKSWRAKLLFAPSSAPGAKQTKRTRAGRKLD